MPPVGFELITSGGEQPQTYTLECAATGTSLEHLDVVKEREISDPVRTQTPFP